MSYARTTTVKQTVSSIASSTVGSSIPGLTMTGRAGEVIVVDWITASAGALTITVDTEVQLTIEHADGSVLYNYLLQDTWVGGRAGTFFLQFPTGLPLLKPSASFEGTSLQAPSTAPQLYITGAPTGTSIMVGYHFEPVTWRVSEH